MRRGIWTVAGTVGLLVVMNSAAALGATITLGAPVANFSKTDPFQQTTTRPCVIGESSCAGSLPKTDIPTGPSGTNYDLLSPLYTYTELLPYTGNGTFSLGIDLNQTNVDQTLGLLHLNVYLGGALIDSYQWNGPKVHAATLQGTGYADYVLAGLTMAPYGINHTFQFRAAVPVANDGGEQFFLMRGESCSPTDPACGGGDNTVPEPATLLLLGAGLVLAGSRLRRRS